MVLYYQVLAEFQYSLTKCKFSKKFKGLLKMSWGALFSPGQWFGHPWAKPYLSSLCDVIDVMEGSAS